MKKTGNGQWAMGNGKRILPLLLASAALVSACAGGDSATRVGAAGPGVVDMVITAPNDSTGSLVVSISGGSVDSIVPGTGLYGSGTTERHGAMLFVTGSMRRNAVVGSLYVPDLSALSSYVVTVSDAANGTTDKALSGVGIQLRAE